MSRTKMPHNNRVSSSSALATNDIWSKTIGYNPYASSADEAKTADAAVQEEQAAGILLLAKMSNLSGSENRGGCKKCGLLGHLTFQCRNAIQVSAKEEESDSSSSYSSSDDDDDPRRRPSFDERDQKRLRSRSRDRSRSPAGRRLDRDDKMDKRGERNSGHSRPDERSVADTMKAMKKDVKKEKKSKDKKSKSKKEKKNKKEKKAKKDKKHDR